MSRGISNFELERVFKDVNNADINENFLGVFPLNKINRFVMFEKIMPNKKYPFIISNTDKAHLPGTHWQSIMNTSPTNGLLFCNSFLIAGLKNFIVTDDKKTISKVLKGIEKMDRTDQKLTLQRLKFLMVGYRNFKVFVGNNQRFFSLVGSFR